MSKGLQEAGTVWKDVMQAALDEKLKTIKTPRINIFNQVELALKYKDSIPLENWKMKLYRKPDPEAVGLLKTKKHRRKVFRVEIIIDKEKLQKGSQIRRSSLQRRRMCMRSDFPMRAPM